MPDKTHRPGGATGAWFRTRSAGLAVGATGALLAGLEVTDILRGSEPDDDLRDQRTSILFGAARAPPVIGSLASLARRRPMPRHAAAWWAGLGLVWVGAAVNRVARHQLGRNYRARVSIVPGHEVVHHGLYRYVRHPMYSGGTLICLGLGTAVAAPASALWALPILSLLRRIRVEEAALRDMPSGCYEQLLSGRSRLIPSIW